MTLDGIDKLRVDPYLFTGPAHASLHDIAHPQLLRHLANPDGFSFISKCGIAGDHEKIRGSWRGTW